MNLAQDYYDCQGAIEVSAQPLERKESGVYSVLKAVVKGIGEFAAEIRNKGLFGTLLDKLDDGSRL